MSPSVRRSDGPSKFPKRKGSYTSMLLSDHLFKYKSKQVPVHLWLYMTILKCLNNKAPIERSQSFMTYSKKKEKKKK